jgi:hypothetical protein
MLEWLLGKKNMPAGKHPNCVSEAIFCADGWQRLTGDDVRIIEQHTDKAGVNHVQAEYRYGDQWIPLTVGWDQKIGQTVTPMTKRHYPNEPFKVWDIDAFIQEQSKYRRPPK